MIRNKDLYGFIGTQGSNINPSKSVQICINPYKSVLVKSVLLKPFFQIFTDNRTFWIFNFYGFIRIYYGYIDYFVIRNKDLYGSIGTQGSNINPSKSVQICINPYKSVLVKSVLLKPFFSDFYRFVQIFTDL